MAQVRWGSGQRRGAFLLTVHHDDTDHRLFAVGTNGMVALQFQYYQRKPPFDAEAKRLELLRRLNAIDGVSISADALTRRPAIPLAVLAEGHRDSEFLDVIEWFIHEVQTA